MKTDQLPRQARDKQKGNSKTKTQTTCVSQEILKGDTYNEKVDVFSYAMCLVELVACR